MNPLYFSAEFRTSAQELSQLVTDSEGEVAFAGRSNAGKSSAINAITRNRKLAKTSKTPGRTQLINFFSLPRQRYLVDLPGYGYAKVSRSRQDQWRATMTRYLQTRPQLRGLILLMDIRHPLTPHDWHMIELHHGSPAALHVMLTKADKLSKNQANKALFAAHGQLETAGVEASLQIFSATKKQGLDDAHSVLDDYLYAGSPPSAKPLAPAPD